MAILIRGKSVCHLCDRVMTSDDEVELFPPGLFELYSDLAHLNDSAVHAACLDQRPEAGRSRHALDEYLERFR
jgi:hypothetical protein